MDDNPLVSAMLVIALFCMAGIALVFFLQWAGFFWQVFFPN